MKTKHWIFGAIVASSAGVLLLVRVAINLPLEAPKATRSEHPASANIGLVTAPIASPSAAAVQPETRPSPTEPAKVLGPGRAEHMVRISPTQTLGTVNGVTITLKDLVALPNEGESRERVMSAEMYDFLLRRAVDREIVFQTARREGIQLNATQEQQLEVARKRSEEPLTGSFDFQPKAENVDFEQRDFAGLLLQTSLAAKAGVGSPHVTAEKVEEHFQRHKAQYGELPSDPEQRQIAWRRIDSEIRQKLASELRAEYEQQLQSYLGRLKSNATIHLSQPLS
jgi:hypothetical protein